MKLIVIGGTIGLIIWGLTLRAAPTLTTASGAEILNRSVSNVVLRGARVIRSSEDNVVLQSVDGIEFSVYGYLENNQATVGDATLVRNGSGWNLVRFKANEGTGETGTLLSVHVRTGMVYGRVAVDGTVRTVRVNDAGFSR